MPLVGVLSLPLIARGIDILHLSTLSPRRYLQKKLKKKKKKTDIYFTKDIDRWKKKKERCFTKDDGDD